MLPVQLAVVVEILALASQLILVSRYLLHKVLFGINFKRVSSILIPDNHGHEELCQRNALRFFFCEFKVVLVIAVDAYCRSHFVLAFSLVMLVKERMLVN